MLLDNLSCQAALALGALKLTAQCYMSLQVQMTNLM